MKLIFSILLLALGMATAGAAQAERVELFANLEPGWTERYQLRSRIELRVDDELADRLQQHIILRMAVVAAEEEGVRLRATVERVTAIHTSAEDTVQVTLPPPEEEPAHDESAALGAIYDTLYESVLEFEVSPDGRVRLVAGLEAAQVAAQAAAPDNPARLLGLFAASSLERTITSIITLDPEHQPRAPGDQWHDEQRVPVLNREATLATRYTLGQIEGDEAHVDGEITVSLLPADAPTPTDPKISIDEQSGELSARWDTGAGRLIERRTETRIVWLAQLGTAPPIESRTTASSTLTITHRPEPAQER